MRRLALFPCDVSCSASFCGALGVDVVSASVSAGSARTIVTSFVVWKLDAYVGASTLVRAKNNVDRGEQRRDDNGFEWHIRCAQAYVESRSSRGTCTLQLSTSISSRENQACTGTSSGRARWRHFLCERGQVARRLSRSRSEVPVECIKQFACPEVFSVPRFSLALVARPHEPLPELSVYIALAGQMTDVAAIEARSCECGSWTRSSRIVTASHGGRESFSSSMLCGYSAGLMLALPLRGGTRRAALCSRCIVDRGGTLSWALVFGWRLASSKAVLSMCSVTLTQS